MKRFSYILFILLTIAISASAQGSIIYQQLFNLTRSELAIDSLMPEFSHTIPLTGNFQDSIYSVQLVYPEFSEMSKEQSEKCKEMLSDCNLSEAEQVEFIPSQSGYKLVSGITQQIVIDRKKGKLEVFFTPIVQHDGTFKTLSGFMLRVSSKVAQKRALNSPAARNISRTGGAAQIYAPHSVLATGRWAKVSVGENNGICELSSDVIKEAGFKDLKKVKIYGYGGNLQDEKILSSYLQETDDLKEVASTYVNGKRYFWANGTVNYKTATSSRTRNNYSNSSYYFITESSEEPLIEDSATFVSKYYNDLAKNHILYEVDNFAWYRGGRNLFEDRPIENGKTVTYNFDLKKFPETATDFKAEVVVTAGDDASYEVLVNGKVANRGNIRLYRYDQGGSSTSQITLKERPTEISIKALSGGPLRLDYIDIYSNDYLAPNFSDRSIPAALYCYNVTNQDLHADSAYQMVIIIPKSLKLLAQANRLKAFHEQHDGFKVKVVSADEIFNEFSSGTPDANAYRRYMKMLYDRAETEDQMPKYLLLFGSGAFDNRMTSNMWKFPNIPDDYLLCYESANSFSEISSYSNDGFFCLLDEGEGDSQLASDREDIAIGRFPVTTAAEAKVIVDKIIAYSENKNAGDWQNTIVFYGDDGDANRHMEDAEFVARSSEAISQDFYIKRVMWDVYKRVSTSTGHTYPEIEKIVKKQIADGALIINYSGHGRADQLSHETVIKIGDLENATNQNLAFWITAACDVTPFNFSTNNMGRASLINQNGGAIGFYGTTHSVYPTENRAINTAMMQALLTPVNGDHVSLGEAQRIAKNQLISKRGDLTANKLQYTLLGDPALKLNFPRQKIVIDSINGKAVGNTLDLVKLKAASVAKIAGHVEKNGAKDDSFNGTASLIVRDAMKEVVGRMNDSELEKAFTYYDRTSTIYKGVANVTQGSFNFVFAVPKDIDYSGSSGMITAFAVDKTTFRTAHGYNENFEASDTEDVYTDSIGPSIYCYLNSPSFQNGGDVNPTPFFYAEISDKDGINASGSSYGHDLQLVIDGDINQTYNLNDNFTCELGDYTKGKTFFTLPQLSVGKHTLRFRAWDILNNSSTTTLSFNVVNALKPELENIYCTKNPARESTSFIVTHNRKGSDVAVEIEVMTMAGRPLWKKTARGASSSNGSFMVDWDLCTESGGKLQTGVYLYRVRLSSDGSDTVSKAKKLIIIN